MPTFAGMTTWFIVMLNLIQHPLTQRISMEREPCVHILASGRHGTTYIGVTSNLMARLYQHRTGAMDGFTGKYGVKHLVHFEMQA